MTKDNKRDANSKQTIFLILRKLQYILLIGSFLLTAAAAYFLVDANRRPSEIEEFIPGYSYEHKAMLDYEVVLKPNSFYEEPVLGPGKSYFTRIVENINVVFSYDFNGSSPVPLTGTYGINAVVTAGELQDTSRTKGPVWKKTFELIPPTPFSQQSGSINIQESFSIYLEDYKEIADELHQELGVTTRPNHLVLEGWVKTSAQAGDENINKELKPELIFPLGQAYFSLSGDRIASGDDTMGTTVITPLHDVLEQRKKAQDAVILFGSITAVLGLIVGIQLKPQLARGKKKKEQLVPRRFRERIVEADMPELPPGKAVPLKSLEDLVKVGDEIARPVVHLVTVQGKSYFYVLDGEVRYEYYDKVPESIESWAARKERKQ